MTSIKLTRAAKKSEVAKFPRTWEAIIAAMPEAVIKSCTSTQLAALADAMRRQYEIGHTAGYADSQA